MHVRMRMYEVVHNISFSVLRVWNFSLRTTNSTEFRARMIRLQGPVPCRCLPCPFLLFLSMKASRLQVNCVVGYAFALSRARHPPHHISTMMRIPLRSPRAGDTRLPAGAHRACPPNRCEKHTSPTWPTLAARQRVKSHTTPPLSLAGGVAHPCG